MGAPVNVVGFMGMSMRMPVVLMLVRVMFMFVMAVMMSMFMLVMPLLLFVSFVLFVVMFVSAAGARCILLVVVRRPFVDAEFHAFNRLPLLAVEVHVESANLQFGEFPLEGGGFDAEITERPNGHDAADAGNAVEKKNTHNFQL